MQVFYKKDLDFLDIKDIFALSLPIFPNVMVSVNVRTGLLSKISGFVSSIKNSRLALTRPPRNGDPKIPDECYNWFWIL